jgi:hypothetical protein
VLLHFFIIGNRIIAEGKCDKRDEHTKECCCHEVAAIGARRRRSASMS